MSVSPGKRRWYSSNEAGWPAAYEKAKSPYHYIALQSITGPSEVWYVVPLANQAARAEYDYVDDHFYVDHPHFLEQDWRLPSRCPTVNGV